MEKNEISFSSPDEGSFSASRTKRTAFWTDSPQSSTKTPSPPLRDDSEDDIPLIPDIDDAPEEEFPGGIAEAPDVPQGNITSFTQLNSDLKKYATFSMMGDVCLGLLSKHLVREADLKEGDNRWSWDLLFTEVSSELRSEWEQTKSQNEAKN